MHTHTEPAPSPAHGTPPELRETLGRPAHAPDSRPAADLAGELFRNHPTREFSLRFWDGRELTLESPPAFTLVFPDPGTFWRLMVARDPAAFAEAYVARRFDIEGDIYRALSLADYVREARLSARALRRAARALRPGQGAVTAALRDVARTARERLETAVRGDAANVRAHYDLSDDFFRLFLDRNMVYSCAYFPDLGADPGASLDEAQQAKLDLICRKLELKPGDRFLDVGCGWGALLIWAAEHYGVSAHGITLSRHQAVTARRRAAELGLASRVTVEERHWHDLPASTFDKIASVGMYEHVGPGAYPAYFGAIWRALAPGGRFLNHGITATPNRPHHIGGEFVLGSVFPGADLGDISETVTAMEHAGWEVLDVQGLRPHYARTLREWHRRFTAHRDEARTLVPDRVLRAWEMYLPGCALAFEAGHVSVYQVLAARGGTGAYARCA